MAKNMKILLVDADSTIPNLALMKLSKFHKLQEDEVSLLKLNISYYPNRKKKGTIPCGYDKIYCSVVFDGTIEYIETNQDVEFGGTGYSISGKLPEQIEKLPPDYSLYNTDTSYNFISRGCIRDCYFCKVREKEGYLRQVNNIDDIVKHKKVKFMDNNFLALPNHKELLEELISKKIKCQFNQGLDIRLVDKENSRLLSELNYLGEYFFAFDDWSYLPQIEEKLQLLYWRKDWQIKFFIYCNPKMEISNITNRVEYVRENRCLPYLMRDISCW